VSVSSGERDKDSSRGESDDVGHPVTVHIGKLARIGVIAAPTSGVRTEGRKFEGGWRKVSVSSGERNKDAGRGESDDVGHPVTVHIGKLARISHQAASSTSATGEPDAGTGAILRRLSPKTATATAKIVLSRRRIVCRSSLYHRSGHTPELTNIKSFR
jgi:hypothetical protein